MAPAAAARARPKHALGTHGWRAHARLEPEGAGDCGRLREVAEVVRLQADREWLQADPRLHAARQRPAADDERMRGLEERLQRLEAKEKARPTVEHGHLGRARACCGIRRFVEAGGIRGLDAASRLGSGRARTLGSRLGGVAGSRGPEPDMTTSMSMSPDRTPDSCKVAASSRSAEPRPMRRMRPGVVSPISCAMTIASPTLPIPTYSRHRAWRARLSSNDRAP